MKSLLLIFFFPLLAAAADKFEDLHIKEAGQFFVIKIIPGNKQTQFFVAGNKALQLDLNKIQIKGSYFLNGQEKPFHLKRTNDSFTTSTPLTGKQLRIEIQDDENRVDILKINLEKN